MWKRLSNPNTLPLLGAYIRGSELVMISEWMENGNITQYLPKNPRANKPSLASHPHNSNSLCLSTDFPDSWQMLHEVLYICTL